MGVYLGFISRQSRAGILEYLERRSRFRASYDEGAVGAEVPLKPPRARWLCVGWFCLLGGLVAAVFQAAQVESFMPIQAFVLGATWPSVVTRVMAGGDPGQGLLPPLQPSSSPSRPSSSGHPKGEVLIGTGQALPQETPLATGGVPARPTGG